ncbi:hypothetical protein N0V90_003190 [Kalmusia sp. IMI 367209]|nr:hypothetical protein N0V90_003190 [Kalmusia sp. IMI 367209]
MSLKLQRLLRPVLASQIRTITTASMTTAQFIHIDPNSYTGKPWAKVDGPGGNYKEHTHQRNVISLRGQEDKFNTDNAGFAVYKSPAKEKLFEDDTTVRNSYYPEVESMLRSNISGIKKIVIFDHTIRRRKKDSPRQPVQQVHVDQTPAAAAARVRRHLPNDEAEELLKGRYQIINVWRPIENPATDTPLAVVDWRSTDPSDFVPVDLLYPKTSINPEDDARGKEVLPDPNSTTSTEGYEIFGETLGVAPNEKHKFYYVKDMKPEEVLLLKCYDSRGEGEEGGKKGTAVRVAHTAFTDPNTPTDAPGRQSIEVRCLVFYE